jgi:hypothetical protein
LAFWSFTHLRRLCPDWSEWGLGDVVGLMGR